MEIYNIHTDFKRRSAGLGGMVPDLLVNQRRYPEHVFRRCLSGRWSSCAAGMS